MTSLQQLRARLAELCQHRDLSDRAREDLARLLEHGGTFELETVINHLRHLPVIQAVDIDADPQTMVLFETIWLERKQAQIAAHNPTDNSVITVSDVILRSRAEA